VRIVAAAIKQGGKIYSASAPKRHHDIIRDMVDNHGIYPPVSGLQGFVDETGVFRSRIIAGAMAIQSGQIERLKWPPELYSEDLW
jgi:hypothetical protein